MMHESDVRYMIDMIREHIKIAAVAIAMNQRAELTERLFLLKHSGKINVDDPGEWVVTDIEERIEAAWLRAFAPKATTPTPTEAT